MTGRHWQITSAGAFGWARAGLLLLHIGLVGYSSHVHSPALDEVAHLAAGVNFWTTGSNRLYCVNPPLVKALATIPVLASDPNTDWHRAVILPGHRSEFQVGQDFLKANPTDFDRYLTQARWVLLPLSITGALTCGRWASELAGPAAGTFCLALWCLSPAILTNAALITPDLAASALAILAVDQFRSGLKRDSTARWVGCGLVLGLAILAKLTCLILLPMLALIHLRVRFRGSGPNQPDGVSPQLFRSWAIILASTVLTINTGYAWRSVGQRLGEFVFFSQAFSGAVNADGMPGAGNRFNDSWLAEIPVPLPADLLVGIDLQKRDFELGMPSYLAGENRLGGWSHYYLAAIGCKTPYAWLVLLTVGILRCGSTSLPASELRLPGLIALTILVFVSLQTGINRYLRYLLPAYPFAFVWLSSNLFTLRTKRDIRLLAWPGMLLGSVPVVLTTPHHHCYFNSIAGGVAHGSFWLIDANVDWGQDLKLLTSWVEEHPDHRLQGTALHTLVPLELYELPGWPAGRVASSPSAGGSSPTVSDRTDNRLPGGWYALSIHRIRSEPDRFRMFLNRKPDQVIGGSIYLFHLTSNHGGTEFDASN